LCSITSRPPEALTNRRDVTLPSSRFCDGPHPFPPWNVVVARDEIAFAAQRLAYASLAEVSDFHPMLLAILAARQIDPRQTKEDQARTLGFAWSYSSGSGLFNGLQRFQIRISPDYSLYRSVPREPRFVSDDQAKVARYPIFHKLMNRDGRISP
jgi:hypothetical protein